MKRLLIVELAAVAVLTTVAGLGFHRVFASSDYLIPVLGAAGLSVFISALGQWRRFSATPALTISVLGFALWSMYSVLFSTMPNGVPTRETLVEFAGGITRGWSEMLSTSLPARPESGLLLVAAFTIWCAAAAGAEFAGRRDSAVGPVVPPLLALLVTLLIGAPGPANSLLLSASFAGLALATVLIHVSRVPASRLVISSDDTAQAHPQNEQSPERRILTGLPLLVGAAIIAPLIVSQLPFSPEDAFDPRSLREVQLEQRATVSPLAGVKAQLTLDPPVPVFQFDTAKLEELGEVQLIKLVTLDSYDGATWDSAATYAKVGAVLPGVKDDLKTEVDQRTIGQIYTIEELPGQWLPTAGRPVAISSSNPGFLVQFDDVSGTLLSESNDLSGLSYEVTSLVPIVTDDDLQFAGRSTASGLDRYTALPPNLPTSMQTLAVEETKDTISPYEQLTALEDYFLDQFGYNDEIEPGHSLAHLEMFLNERRVGYSEQFAASFAVLARSLGFPSRLAVGYKLTSTDETGGAVGTRTEVTSDQIHVWPQIYLDKVGWIDFDPTPTDALPFETKKEPPVSVPTGNYLEEVAEPRVVGPGLGNLTRKDPGLFSGPILSIALALLAVVFLLGLLIVMKWLRRRSRRSSPNPTDQILGAWAEVVDRLVELGLGVPDSQTAKEVASSNSAEIGPAPTARLNAMIPLVTMAIYAPEEPADLDADEMWTHVRAFRQELYAERSKFSEAMAFLNPKPFFASRR